MGKLKDIGVAIPQALAYPFVIFGLWIVRKIFNIPKRRSKER